ncbi:MAG TPA: VCBS repeat-containing protein, partial [Planctomycetota bacterium]|nr:VCBS repeat-containing protein [Planctomycetota bacterium]
ALGDLDGDGDLDAFAPLPSDRPLLNDGTGVFTLGTAPSSSAPGLSTALALGDIDGDGDLDAVSAKDAGCTFVSCLGAQNRLYLNNGAGVFTDASSQIPEFDDWTDAVALADVDGDGDLDALLGTEGREGLPNRLLLNDGTGTFADASGEDPSSPPSDRAVAVGLGDLDGDGDLDAFVSQFSNDYASPYPPGNGVYLNDGTGRLLEAPVQPDGYFAGMRVAVGDLDGDGDLDAVKVNGFDPASLGFPLRYLNDGAGGFALAANPPPLGVFMDVALGDLDGDGDLDALFGMGVNPGASNNTVRAYLNNGLGLFTWVPAATPSGPSLTARAVALGDLDGDGDLDAYLGTGGDCTSSACAGQQDRLLLNNGAGLFTFALPIPLSPLDPTLSAALGDLDGDGDLDVLVGN